MVTTFFFWLGMTCVVIACFYDSYIHGRFRTSTLVGVFVIFGIGMVVWVYEIQILRMLYGGMCLSWSVFFLFFGRFHRLFLESSAITDILSSQAIDTSSQHIDSFCRKVDQDVVILMRLYNEQDTVADTLHDLYEQGFRHVLIVDDGSSDMSSDRIGRVTQQHQDMNILVIHHLTRRGGGAANKTLFSIVRRYDFTNEWFITFDSDGQMSAKDIFSFLDVSLQDPSIKILLGSRFVVDGSTTNLSFIRRMILRGSRIVTFIFSRIWLSDPHNGFRMIHRSLFSDLKLQSDDMYYASEIVQIVQKKGWRYQEVPVHINYSSYSYQKGQKNRNALRILTHFMYEHIFCR